MPQIHAFESSGEAYDASQTRDSIADGDILLVPSEGIAAVLIVAYPTLAAGTEREQSAFHTAVGGYAAFETMDGGKYAVSRSIAAQCLTPEGVLTEAGAEAVAASEARDEAEFEAFMASLEGGS